MSQTPFRHESTTQRSLFASRYQSTHSFNLLLLWKALNAADGDGAILNDDAVQCQLSICHTVKLPEVLNLHMNLYRVWMTSSRLTFTSRRQPGYLTAYVHSVPIGTSSSRWKLSRLCITLLPNPNDRFQTAAEANEPNAAHKEKHRCPKREEPVDKSGIKS